MPGVRVPQPAGDDGPAGGGCGACHGQDAPHEQGGQHPPQLLPVRDVRVEGSHLLLPVTAWHLMQARLARLGVMEETHEFVDLKWMIPSCLKVWSLSGAPACNQEGFCVASISVVLHSADSGCCRQWPLAFSTVWASDAAAASLADLQAMRQAQSGLPQLLQCQHHCPSRALCIRSTTSVLNLGFYGLGLALKV